MAALWRVLRCNATPPQAAADELRSARVEAAAVAEEAERLRSEMGAAHAAAEAADRRAAAAAADAANAESAAEARAAAAHAAAEQQVPQRRAPLLAFFIFNSSGFKIGVSGINFLVSTYQTAYATLQCGKSYASPCFCKKKC